MQRGRANYALNGLDSSSRSHVRGEVFKFLKKLIVTDVTPGRADAGLIGQALVPYYRQLLPVMSISPGWSGTATPRPVQRRQPDRQILNQGRRPSTSRTTMSSTSSDSSTSTTLNC